MNELKTWEPHTKWEKKERKVIPVPALPTIDAKLLTDPGELFLFLTQWTCPFGNEEAYYGSMLLSLGFKRDGLGNWWKQIGDTAATCFVAHLDTADDEAEPVTRVVEGNICRTDKKTILGADDRAGVTALLYLQNRGVPGLYYLFCGEESGCVGSRRAAANGYVPEGYQRCVSFDRRGKTSIITRQCGTRTCSDAFAWELSNALNAFGFQYSPDSNGLFTDSKEFAKTVPECTNISVGYSSPHSNNEEQDLAHLTYLCEVCAEIDWEGLGTHRDPSEVDTTSRYQGSWKSSWKGSDYSGVDYYGSGWEHWRDKEDIETYGYSTTRYDKDYLDAIDNSIEAIDRIVEAFVTHREIDMGDIHDLVCEKPYDTAENIELLLDSLHTRIKWISSDDD